MLFFFSSGMKHLQHSLNKSWFGVGMFVEVWRFDDWVAASAKLHRFFLNCKRSIIFNIVECAEASNSIPDHTTMVVGSLLPPEMTVMFFAIG